jgi:hypothetical protein
VHAGGGGGCHSLSHRESGCRGGEYHFCGAGKRSRIAYLESPALPNTLAPFLSPNILSSVPPTGSLLPSLPTTCSRPATTELLPCVWVQMLSDPEAALAVVIGDDGVAAGLSAGKVIS